MARRRAVGWDTNCIISLLCEWHEFFPATDAFWKKHRRSRHIVSVHSLLEAYRVLTRLPPPYRFSPDAARTILSDGLQGFEVAPFLADQARRTVEQMADLGLVGGIVYDAAIASSLADAGVTLLVTWNARHLEAVAPKQVRVRAPSGEI